MKISLENYKGSNIEKEFINNDLEKAEGSRGGRVIGHTCSGKPIYANFNHPSHKNFTAEDHKDASDVNGEEHRKIDPMNMSGVVNKQTVYSKNSDKHYAEFQNKSPKILPTDDEIHSKLKDNVNKRVLFFRQIAFT